MPSFLVSSPLSRAGPGPWLNGIFLTRPGVVRRGQRKGALGELRVLGGRGQPGHSSLGGLDLGAELQRLALWCRDRLGARRGRSGWDPPRGAARGRAPPHCFLEGRGEGQGSRPDTWTRWGAPARTLPLPGLAGPGGGGGSEFALCPHLPGQVPQALTLPCPPRPLGGASEPLALLCAQSSLVAVTPQCATQLAPGRLTPPAPESSLFNSPAATRPGAQVALHVLPQPRDRLQGPRALFLVDLSRRHQELPQPGQQLLRPTNSTAICARPQAGAFWAEPHTAGWISGGTLVIRGHSGVAYLYPLVRGPKIQNKTMLDEPKRVWAKLVATPAASRTPVGQHGSLAYRGAS